MKSKQIWREIDYISRKDIDVEKCRYLFSIFIERLKEEQNEPVTNFTSLK